MTFASKVWRLLVGIKDGLVLLLMLLFFMLLAGALSSRPNVASVQDGALLLRFDGAIVEEPEGLDSLSQLLSAQAPSGQYAVRDVVHALRAAAKDDRIKAVVFDLSMFTGAGAVHVQEVGEAIDEVRAAKKPVLTFATGYADDGLALAAHASEVWVDPLGGAFVTGPGGSNLYYAGLIEKLKVTAHVFRVGTFKSAVEPYLRNDMSAESRAATGVVYAALWEGWKANVKKARPKAQIDRVAADPVGWIKAAGGDAAKAALDAGLVDRLGDATAFGKRVAEVAGKDTLSEAPGAFAHTSLRTWLAANPKNGSGRKIGVVTVAGEIVDGDAGPGTAGGDRIAAALDAALDDDLAALVVRVDSPGGSIFASERIRTAVERYRAKGVPVAVSMANLAASGGYWVATPANRIFAEPGTITGSIGVFGLIPTFERTLGDYGVTADGIKTTPLSGQPDVVGGLTPEVQAMVQANIESSYARFLSLVGKARGKTPEQVDAMAQGRVWDGGTARQLGLVDQFGGLDEALAWAAQSAKLKDGEWHAVALGGTQDPWFAALQQMRDSDSDARIGGQGRDWTSMAAERQIAAVGQALVGVERLLSVRGVQAYCLECPEPVATARVPANMTGWLALARHFLPTGT